VPFDGSGVVGIIHDFTITLACNGFRKRKLFLLALLLLEHVGGLLLLLDQFAGIAGDQHAEHLILLEHIINGLCMAQNNP
jgi:hypothetical protein